MHRLLTTVCTAVVRLALGFWVGGAVLFVMTGVAEIREQAFDSMIRDRLATIRFPLYYLYCWICLGAALGGGLCGLMVAPRGCLRKRLLASTALTLTSLLIAAGDYHWVYQPLQALITPPGQTRSQQFMVLHQRSRRINEIHVTLALIAAVIICLPEKHSSCPPTMPHADR